MNSELKIYFRNAKDELGCAKNLYDNGFYRGAVNHCYYTCLWLVRGLLTEKKYLQNLIMERQCFFMNIMSRREMCQEK